MAVPTINPIPRLVKIIYQKLAADAALTALIGGSAPRIYEAQSSGAVSLPEEGGPSPWPADPEFPCVRFKTVAVRHGRGNGGRRGPTRALVQVEGIALGEDIQALGPIADRIEVVLGWRVQGTESGLTVCGSSSSEAMDVTETDLPESYKRLGGFYEFFCHQAE